MGCRAVIVAEDVTKENKHEKMGIYLHWYGSEDSVKRLLEVCKKRHMRGVVNDPLYGWARACQAFADTLTEDDLKSPYETAKSHAYETGIGIGIVKNLDCRNWDNGVYYIDDNFDIVKHTNGAELED